MRCEADGHFVNALEEAKLKLRGGVPMLEVLAAREWKRHVLEPQEGRDASAAEAMIDEACVKMITSRGAIASVLLER